MNSPKPPDPETQADRIEEALFRGNKIEAINLYRDQTGLGLLDAKAAVEKVERQLRASSPEEFVAPAGEGRPVLAGVFIATATILLWWLLRS